MEDVDVMANSCVLESHKRDTLVEVHLSTQHQPVSERTHKHPLLPWLVKITLPSNCCFISLDDAPPSPQTHIILVSDDCCSSISVEQLSAEIC